MENRYIQKKRILMMHALPVIFLLYLSGCSALWSVPFTLKEIKDYVSGQERSFAYPLDRTMKAIVFVTRKDGFDLERIEYFNQKCLIQAKWEYTSVEIVLETVTPKMTRVTGRVQSNKLSREYSCEGALFDEVQGILNRKHPLNWKEMALGMATVHVSTEKGSQIMAYLRKGSEVEIIEERGEWGKVSLMDRYSGFIAMKHLYVK